MLDLRPLTLHDLPAVVALEQATYPDLLLEGEEEFAHKLEAFGRGAFGVFDGETLAAYLFCHPWTLGEVFVLGSGRWSVPPAPSCLYIHDLAVDHCYRSMKLAGRLLDEAYHLARSERLEHIALVAVLGSSTFWEHHGFTVQRTLEYRPGIAASYMTKGVL